MDYTIIGSVVNLAARLQSHADFDGILLGHETYSLVKDEVSTAEQDPITVKGFAEPIRCYKVLGIYDDLVKEGAVIREEADGFKFLLDLKKRGKAEAVEALEAILTRLKESPKGRAHRNHSQSHRREERQQDRARPRHVADEARHLDAALLADRPHHEIGRVADIGVGAHEHRAGRDGEQRRGERPH